MTQMESILLTQNSNSPNLLEEFEDQLANLGRRKKVFRQAKECHLIHRPQATKFDPRSDSNRDQQHLPQTWISTHSYPFLSFQPHKCSLLHGPKENPEEQYILSTIHHHHFFGPIAHSVVLTSFACFDCSKTLIFCYYLCGSMSLSQSYHLPSSF